MKLKLLMRLLLMFGFSLQLVFVGAEGARNKTCLIVSPLSFWLTRTPVEKVEKESLHGNYFRNNYIAL